MVRLWDYQGLLRNGSLADVRSQVEVACTNDLIPIFAAEYEPIHVRLPLVFPQLEEACYNGKLGFTLSKVDFACLLVHRSLLSLDGLLSSVPLNE